MADVTALTIFDQAPMPAHLADPAFESNIVVQDKINQLSFRGKVWRVNLEGKETNVNNSDGDPVQSVQIVILDYNKLRGRSYYSGGYDENKTAPPACWSKDGVTPDAEVKEKQAATCATCPQSVKGSKITEAGKEVTACSQFKRMVVVPLADTKFAPLLMKIPQTSMWDKDNADNEAKGFYAFDQYMEMLKRKGVQNTAQVITKVKFDARTAYPKLLFSAFGWTPATETENIKLQLADRPKLEALLNVVHTPSKPEPGPVAEYEEPVTQAVAAQVAAVAVTTPVTPAAPAKPATRPRPAPAPAAPAPAPTVVVPVGDPDDNVVLPGSAAAPAAAAPAAAKAPAAAPAATAAPTADGLAALMGTWDDAKKE